MNLQFKHVEVDDIAIMLPFYTMRKNKTCDSVYMESFIWKEFYHVQYAIWEGKALLWLMEYGGRCFSAMPLCREEDLPGAFKAIETYFNEELGYPLVINLADEYAVQYLNLPEEEYYVQEQEDSRDYLYLGQAMRNLAGKKLHKKKNRVNAFMREYEGRYEYRALCCSDSQYVWEFLDKWRATKGEDVEEHLDYEVRGIHDILKNCSNLNVKMGGVFIDGQLEAFTIGSYNPIENMAVIHIEKANPEINGLYQYINRQFLIEEFPEVEWVNREDDLGIEGLRKAKMSYYPADFARKYLVEQIRDGKQGYKWAEEIGNTSSGEELYYLSDSDKPETKALWHHCFPEDSRSFVDYYYNEKIKDNQILVKKVNGMIVSMAQMNPYEAQLKGRSFKTDYIVGVATEEKWRHKGHMRDILKRMLQDMYNEKKPFTFLMAADEAIYLPFDFAVINKTGTAALKQNEGVRLNRVVCQDRKEDCEKAAVYMEQWLEKRYDLYCKRDASYVSRLLKELGSENGELEFLYEGEELSGLQAFWGIEKREERLLYADGHLTEGADAEKKLSDMHPIMFRITNLEALLPVFGLKPGEVERIELVFQIEDLFIEENAGVYHWVLTPDSSEVKRIVQKEQLSAAGISSGDMSKSGVAKIRIKDMASWLFGHQKPADLWPDAEKGMLSQMASVGVLEKVFIDEIV